MTTEYAEVLSEVSEILKHMDPKDTNKVPTNLMNFIEQNKSKDYNFTLTANEPFSNQKIKRETLAFLGALVLNYWSENAESQNEFYNLLKENEQKYQSEIRKKYNTDNLFPEKIKTPITPVTAMIEYKEEKWFVKIIHKLKEFFNKLI